MATTPIVFSSHWAAASSAPRWYRSPSMGTIRGSTSQYRQNFSQHTRTLAPMTRFGRSVGLPAARPGGGPPVVWMPALPGQRHQVLLEVEPFVRASSRTGPDRTSRSVLRRRLAAAFEQMAGEGNPVPFRMKWLVAIPEQHSHPL